MRRRLLASTTLIALAAVLILGVPLGIVGARLVRTDATSRLEREADAVAAAVQRQLSQHRPLDRDDLLSLIHHGDRIVVAVPAQAQSERLERTIAELLSMARDERRASSGPLDAGALAMEHAAAWRPVFARVGGQLECVVTPGLRVRATAGAIGQG